MNRDYLPGIEDYISRPRIGRILAESLKYPLVLVIAGPGYGKTLSVAYFLKKQNVRLAWARMTKRRSGTAEFWEDFVRAMQKELPEYAKKLDELGFPGTAGSYERFRQITDEESHAGEKIVIVIDNYERILDKAVIAFIDNLADSEIDNLTVYILCNLKLPFAGMLPAKGQFRITDEDLAFTVDEAVMMFSHYGVVATENTIERVVVGTGGWPLALRLLGASTKKSANSLEGKTSMQMAEELFEQNYFVDYPPDIQVQMINFSLLPQFSLEMIDASQHAIKGEIYDILLRHPFVSRDYTTGLFIFQPMYHDFLRLKQDFLSHEVRHAFALSAGKWFLAHQMPTEAMDSFWEAADYFGFLEAVAALPKVRHQKSRTDQILMRLEQIPRTFADAHPEVDYGIAFMHLNAANVKKAREIFLSIEERVKSGPETEERVLLLGDVYATLADISIYLNEGSGLDWIKKAYELIPGGSRTHSRELMILGNNTAFFLPGTEPGLLEDMVDHFMEFAPYADAVMNGNGFGYEYLFAGEAAYFRGDMEKFAVMMDSAILKARRTRQHDIICNAILGQIRIEAYYANYKNALSRLEELKAYVAAQDQVWLYELRDCAIAWFYMLIGDYDKIPSWFGDDISGLEEFPIALGRNRLTMACYMLMKGEISKGYAAILQLEKALANKGRWYEKFCLNILKMKYHIQAGETEAFEELFAKTYDMVYANDIKIAFSTFGKEAMAIIDKKRKLGTEGYDEQWLEDVYSDALSYAKRLQAMRLAHFGDGSTGPSKSALALTKREDETLRYLAQGLTQKEIAKMMEISTNAVKKHVKNIYSKLGAVNRADAIHIASISGLVDLIHD